MTSEYTLEEYDVAVIGAGHAGCEAALAAARLGMKTAIFTLSLDCIANMPCNPCIGGSAKGQIVCEIDALGGEMGKAACQLYTVPGSLQFPDKPVQFFPGGKAYTVKAGIYLQMYSLHRYQASLLLLQGPCHQASSIPRQVISSMNRPKGWSPM